jgi:hypothetical protein
MLFEGDRKERAAREVTMFASHFLMLGLLVTANLCKTDAPRPMVAGNGDSQLEERPLSGFTRIESHLPIPVRVSQGETDFVSVTADSNVAPLIRIHVRGDTLVLDAPVTFTTASPTHVDVTLPILRSVDQEGSGAVEVAMREEGDVHLNQVGPGNLSFDGSAGTLEVESFGSGAAVVRGTVGRFLASLMGSGSVDAAGLWVEDGGSLAMLGSGSLRASLEGDTTITNSGSGDVEAAVNDGSASFGVDGSGSIRWSGNATVEAAKVSGSGAIERG